MKILIVNVREDRLEYLAAILREKLTKHLSMSDIKVEETLVEVEREWDSGLIHKEWRKVVSFELTELTPFPNSHVMAVFASAFEGSRLCFEAPEIGMCWMVG